MICGILAVILLPLCPDRPVEAKEMSKKELRLLRELQAESGAAFQIVWDERAKTPSVLEGKLTRTSNHSPEWIAFEAFERLKPLYGIKRPRTDLKVEKMDRDPSGSSRVHLRHMLFKTPVWGDELIVEIDAEGVVRQIRGRYCRGLEEKLFGRPMRAAVSPEKALEKAKSALPAGWREERGDVEAYYLPSRDGTPLVYVVTFPAEGTRSGKWKVMVHALTGKTIETFEEGDPVGETPGGVPPDAGRGRGVVPLPAG